MRQGRGPLQHAGHRLHGATRQLQLTGDQGYGQGYPLDVGG